MTTYPDLPPDTEPVSSWPAYVRALIDAASGSTILVTVSALAAGSTEFAGNDVAIEVIQLSAAGAVNIASITSPENGQIKIIYAMDSDITLIDGSGNLELTGGNPAASDLPMQAGDLIAFLYDSTDGAWKEMFRLLI